jgi:drug/metabolite transporter (DMT)-like permease
MNGDRPALGMLFMLGFCVLAPLGDAIAKILGGTIPLAQILTVRFGIQALLLVPLAWSSGISLKMDKQILFLTVIRTILHIIGIGAMFTALRFMPLADAVAIAFVMPFMLLLLGRYLLNEEVGIRRLSACAVGFVGTLLVIQPSFAAVGPPALLPLVVAVTFAIFMLVTRTIARRASPLAIQAVSGVQATAILGAITLVGAGTDLPMLGVVIPGQTDSLLLLSIGVIGTVVHLFMTLSLRFAPSATLAPMQYLEIPFATLFGWLIFKDLPNSMAALGIVITMVSGFYIVWRERARVLPVPPET